MSCFMQRMSFAILLYLNRVDIEEAVRLLLVSYLDLGFLAFLGYAGPLNPEGL